MYSLLTFFLALFALGNGAHATGTLCCGQNICPQPAYSTQLPHSCMLNASTMPLAFSLVGDLVRCPVVPRVDNAVRADLAFAPPARPAAHPRPLGAMVRRARAVTCMALWVAGPVGAIPS